MAEANLDGTRTEYFEVDCAEATLLTLLRECFEEHWREVIFGPCIEGAVYEGRFAERPTVALSDGYATIDVPGAASWHFHLCIGAHRGSAARPRRVAAMHPRRVLPSSRHEGRGQRVGTSSVERSRRADAHGVLSESVDRSRRATLRRRAGLVAAPALDAASRALRGSASGGASYPRRASGHPLTRNQDESFTARELRVLRALRSPQGIQRTLDAMPYHLAGTAWSPRRVLRERTAYCLEGAIFAAAALRVLGYPPLLLDLEA